MMHISIVLIKGLCNFTDIVVFFKKIIDNAINISKKFAHKYKLRITMHKGIVPSLMC